MAIFKNFFGNQQSIEMVTSALDLVTAVAGFASTPKAIDTQLDKVRAISAQLPAGSVIPEKDEAVLFEVYLKIEQYLMTSDPIRTFTQQELRGRASNGLLARLEAYENKRNKV